MTTATSMWIESQGSRWEIDATLDRYRRWPKEERPRENGWGGADQGPLQDLVWHDLGAWGAHPFLPLLILQLPDGSAIRAPLDRETWTSLKDAGHIWESCL